MNDYDKAYGADSDYFGHASAPLLERFTHILKPHGRVLDIGVGQGRNALPLAAAGMRVTGIDPSAEAIAQTGRLALEAGLTLELRQGGVLDFAPDELFDTVLCFGLLQILSRPEINELFRRIRDWSAPDSILLLVAWHENDPSREKYQGIWEPVGRHSFRSPDGTHRTYLAHGEILDLAKGWEVLHHEESMGPGHSHGDGAEHWHGNVEFVARRV